MQPLCLITRFGEGIAIRIAIIGGGIMGVAYIVALTQHCTEGITSLEVFDSCSSGGEASFSGQARAHSGGSSMLFDSTEITARKYTGQAYLNALGALDSVKQAIYGFENGSEYDTFIAKAACAGVPFKEFSPGNGLRKAFAPSTREFTVTFEHPTNFARLRYGMLQFLKQKYGNQFRLTPRDIDHVAILNNNQLQLRSKGEVVGDYDLVINSAGRFAAQIKVVDRLPMIQMKQARWPFFCVKQCSLGDLSASYRRVLTLVDRDRWIPTFIVHQEGIITLDTKCPDLEISDDPFVLRPQGPRPFNPRDKTQRVMFDKIREAFPLTKSLQKEDIAVVYGVHGRTFGSGSVHYTPSDIMEIYTYDDLDTYLMPFGGLATTCFYDAFNVADRIASKFAFHRYTHTERLVWLRQMGLPNYLRCVSGPPNDDDKARWERDYRCDSDAEAA